jgi:hypothetical protein
VESGKTSALTAVVLPPTTSAYKGAAMSDAVDDFVKGFQDGLKKDPGEKLRPWAKGVLYFVVGVVFLIGAFSLLLNFGILK